MLNGGASSSLEIGKGITSVLDITLIHLAVISIPSYFDCLCSFTVPIISITVSGNKEFTISLSTIILQ